MVSNQCRSSILYINEITWAYIHYILGGILSEKKKTCVKFVLWYFLWLTKLSKINVEVVSCVLTPMKIELWNWVSFCSGWTFYVSRKLIRGILYFFFYTAWLWWPLFGYKICIDWIFLNLRKNEKVFWKIEIFSRWRLVLYQFLEKFSTYWAHFFLCNLFLVISSYVPENKFLGFLVFRKSWKLEIKICGWSP